MAGYTRAVAHAKKCQVRRAVNVGTQCDKHQGDGIFDSWHEVDQQGVRQIYKNYHNGFAKLIRNEKGTH